MSIKSLSPITIGNYTLPHTDGTAGQVLVTNGSGVVTFATPGASTNNYLTGLSFNTTNGVLTATVSGASNVTVDLDNRYALTSHTHAYDNYQSWNLKTNGVQRTTVQSGGILDLVAGSNVALSYGAGGVVTISSTDTNTDTNNYLTGVSFSTSTGIITFTRSGLSNLTVDIDGKYLPLAGGTMSGDILLNANSVKFDQTGTRSWDISAGSGNLNITSGDSAGLVFLSPGISVEDDAFIGGNVGIGTTSPSQKLEVNGALKFYGLTSSDFAQTGGQIDYYDTGRQFRFNAYKSDSTGAEIVFNTGGTSSFDQRMVITSAGNVGIGTTSPSEKLNVNGNVQIGTTTSTDNNLRIGGGNSSGGRVFIQYSGDSSYLDSYGGHGGAQRYRDFKIRARNLNLQGNNGSGITINTSGNVGIGTTSPSNKLDIVGSVNVNDTSFFRYNGDTGLIGSATSIAGGNSIQLGIRAANDILFATGGFTERMRIASTGNVGIGTTSPGNKLQIGSVGSTGYSGNAVAWGDGTRAGAIYIDSTASWLYASGDQIFAPGTGEKVRITSSGNVGIGTTSPSQKLHVFSAGYPQMRLQSNGGTWQVGVSTGNDLAFRKGTSGSNYPLWLDSSGNVGIGTTSPSTKLDVSGVITATGGNSTNWNTAYGWGDHASAGYITSVTNVSGYSGTLIYQDNRTIAPSALAANRLNFGFTSWTNNNSSPYADFIHLRSYQDASGGSDNLVMFKKSGIGMRIWQQAYGSSTPYSTFADVWTSIDFTSSNVSNWNTAYSWGNHASQGYATQTYVNTAVSNLVASAPSTLDTLNELAAALGDDANFSTTVTNSIATKLPLAGGTLTGDLRFNQGNGYGRIAFTDNYHGMILRGYPNNSAGAVTAGDVTSLVQHSGDFRFYRTNGSVNEIYFQVNSTAAYHRGNQIWDAGDFTSTNVSNWNTAYGWGDHSGVYLPIGGKAADSNLLDGYDQTDFIRIAANSSSPTNALFAIGSAGGRNFIQSHGGQPLDINPLGNTVTVGSSLIVSGTIETTSLLISNTAPFLDFVDTNSFTDPNDRFRIRAAGNVGQVRWYDASAGTDTVLMTFNPNGTIGVDGTIDMGTNTITDTKVGQWDTSYGWGNHATAGYATLSGSNSFANSYNEFGNGVGSVSNDGGWNARLNVAGTQHARLDVKSVSDGIITSMFAHTGNGAGKMGTVSNHPLKLMIGGSDKATLDSGGGFTLTGGLTSTTVNTGQGATEVHLMNQNVRTSDEVTFNKVNINQGVIANEENVNVTISGNHNFISGVPLNYSAAFFDFVIKRGFDLRAGTVMACHDGSNVEYTETSTADLGYTGDVLLFVAIDNNKLTLFADVASDVWEIKVLVRAI